MNTTSICPSCGKPLAPNAPKGLCAECLLQAGLGTGADWAGDTAPGAPSAGFVPPTVEELAKNFPQLEILELVGKGGMGAVYKARQTKLNRIVALKILPPDIGHQPAFAQRFTREAQALAQLNHPGIVTLYEFGETSGQFYFLMEFVDGVNLRQLMLAGRVSAREALAIVPQICEALQFAHDQGIVHRDIKPENVLVDRRGRVKVADFGLAKIIGHQAAEKSAGGGPGPASTALSDASKVMGTPQYMSPEQIAAPGEVDHRADIYALGVVFYQMLTGELPGKKLEPPSTKVSIDVRLDEIVLRALEKNPELRYQQASVLKTQIETIASDSGQPAARTPLRQAQGFEYKSQRTLFGLPLLHVAAGLDAPTGRVKTARGIIAIGGRAHGVLAFGGMASGVFAFGGLAIGVFAFGGCALGLLSFGGVAVALLFALGGGAIAPVALGGGAVGYFAFGGKGVGAHVLDSMTRDPVASHFFRSWAQSLMANAQWIDLFFVGFILSIAIGVPLWLRRQAVHRPSRIGATPAEPQRRRPFSRIMLIGLWTVAALSLLVAGIWHPAGNGRAGKPLSLADSPPELKKQPTREVFLAGLSKPEVPWAWQELNQRAESGDIGVPDADMIVEGLTAWFRREYPAGYNQPLFNLGLFLQTLEKRHLVSETNALDFLTAYRGNPSFDPLPRLREGAQTLNAVCSLGGPWDENLFGYQLLNEVRGFTIDGRPLPARSPFGFSPQNWNQQYCNMELDLPALAPGQHIVRCEVYSAFAAVADLVGLDPGAPGKEWPPAKRQWTRFCEAPLMVYAKDAVIVSLAGDPALNPVASGALSAGRVIIRSKGGRLTAAVDINYQPKPAVPVSVDVTLRIAGRTFNCGTLWCYQTVDGRSTARGGELRAELDRLAPDIKEAEIVLTPDAQMAEPRAGVDRIWGKEIVFSHVPVVRQDLSETGHALAEASPSDPPQLQFLAWQDQWQTNHSAAARHPDGSPVTNSEELKWLRSVEAGGCNNQHSPPPRFLHLCFSHPLFDSSSFTDVALLDDSNNVIPPGADAMMCGSGEDANPYNGQLGWWVRTFSPGPAALAAHHLTVRLRYTVGPLEQTNFVFAPQDHASSTLEGESLLSGVGQNADGKAFVSIAVNASQMKSRKFGVIAVTKDGRQLAGSGSESGFAGDVGASTAEFDFTVPLADVAKFIIGTRPIRTHEWENVVLP